MRLKKIVYNICIIVCLAGCEEREKAEIKLTPEVEYNSEDWSEIWSSMNDINNFNFPRDVKLYLDLKPEHNGRIDGSIWKLIEWATYDGNDYDLLIKAEFKRKAYLNLKCYFLKDAEKVKCRFGNNLFLLDYKENLELRKLLSVIGIREDEVLKDLGIEKSFIRDLIKEYYFNDLKISSKGEEYIDIEVEQYELAWEDEPRKKVKVKEKRLVPIIVKDSLEYKIISKLKEGYKDFYFKKLDLISIEENRDDFKKGGAVINFQEYVENIEKGIIRDLINFYKDKNSKLVFEVKDSIKLELDNKVEG